MWLNFIILNLQDGFLMVQFLACLFHKNTIFFSQQNPVKDFSNFHTFVISIGWQCPKFLYWNILMNSIVFLVANISVPRAKKITSVSLRWEKVLLFHFFYKTISSFGKGLVPLRISFIYAKHQTKICWLGLADNWHPINQWEEAQLPVFFRYYRLMLLFTYSLKYIITI